MKLGMLVRYRTRRYWKRNKKRGSPCLFSRHNADKYGYNVTFGDLRAQQISTGDYFPMRRVISHIVRLSLIVYSSTYQKKCLQISCIISAFKRKHNLDLLCWARYVSICSIISFAKKVAIDFCQFFFSVIEDIVLIEFIK